MLDWLQAQIVPELPLRDLVVVHEMGEASPDVIGDRGRGDDGTVSRGAVIAASCVRHGKGASHLPGASEGPEVVRLTLPQSVMTPKECPGEP